MPLTPKKTSASDETNQSDLPFGALPKGEVATSKTPKRKTAKKKAVRRKAAGADADSGDAAPAKAPAADADGAAADRKVVRKRSRTVEASMAEKTSSAAKSSAAKADTAKSSTAKSTNAKTAAAKKAAPAAPEAEQDDGAQERPKSARATGSQAKASKPTAAQESSVEGRPEAGATRAKDEPARSEAPEADSYDANSGDGEGEPRKRRSRRGRRRKRRDDEAGEGDGAETAQAKPANGKWAQAPPEGEGGPRKKRRRRRRRGKGGEGDESEGAQKSAQQLPQKGGGQKGGGQKASHKTGQQTGPQAGKKDWKKDWKKDRPSGPAPKGDGQDSSNPEEGAADTDWSDDEPEVDAWEREEHDEPRGGKPARKESSVGEGMFFLEKGQVSVLRDLESQWLPSRYDIYVPKALVQKFKLHDGMIVKGPVSRGYKHKLQLNGVTEIDGKPPEYWRKKPFFKNLTSIDPDFHYAVGDVTDEVSMRVLDLIAPIGRGQRGLLVAPPRTGKTTLMRQFAAGIEKGYPDVHLIVLLIDERPEEATEWKRSVERGQVFVSTADETAKNHINLAEVVWRRATRLVEMGEDVVVLLDSITRLARAYNNQSGGSGRTMSGGLDSRAMERPRKFFGSARNTVEAGSLTIIGTTLVDTGSRMDQLVFEEFKGTGNMEIVLNRKLADRRIFPAIDIEKSGTRKEEKLVGLRRLKLIHVLRRVLSRMHFAEAADLLITRLSDVDRTDQFLERFTVDPEA